MEDNNVNVDNFREFNVNEKQQTLFENALRRGQLDEVRQGELLKKISGYS